ncbi:Odorant receptor 37 [Cephus cinctus]|uniref:Odorant receptor n=1 Tax=Cephus cinctus TaxID=211228 RepID=A0A3L9LSY3_CEPCN|nr:odorant receptor 49b isoform X2 [Cephus cinctus]RLZ02241.1 Odorant receptor 37 [Cephus cinctus]
MSHHSDIGVSLKITKYSMKLIGLWKADNRTENFFMTLIFFYTSGMVVVGVIYLVTDLFYVLDDIYKAVNIICPTIALINITGKLIIFIINRDEVMNILKRIENAIKNEIYGEYEINAVKDCERQCVGLAITFGILTQGATANYVILPFVENFTGNATRKTLPVPMHFGNLPYDESPYFEMGLCIEALISISTGACLVSLNNFLTITNLHLACQFRILHHKLKLTCKSDLDTMGFNDSRDAYSKLKKCIKTHKMLIDHTGQVEHVYTYVILMQMLSSDILICTSGFQVFFFSGTILRFIFRASFFLTTIGEFFLFSWSCNEIIVASENVGDGGYDTTWYSLIATDHGKAYRNGLQLLIMRSHHPCYLTAGKFCVISLHSFCAVMTTATSYFTLLRNFVDEDEFRNK